MRRLGEENESQHQPYLASGNMAGRLTRSSAGTTAGHVRKDRLGSGSNGCGDALGTRGDLYQGGQNGWCQQVADKPFQEYSCGHSPVPTDSAPETMELKMSPMSA